MTYQADLMNNQTIFVFVQTIMIFAGLVLAAVQLENWRGEHIGIKQIDLVTEIVDASRKLAFEISLFRKGARVLAPNRVSSGSLAVYNGFL